MKNLLPVIAVVGVLVLALAAVVGLKAAFHSDRVDAPPAVIVPAPPVPHPAPPPRVTGDYVQFASLRTKDEAKDAIDQLKRYADLFDPDLLAVYQVEINGKLWYRVVLRMKDRASAERLCSIIKSRGGDCLAISFN